MTDRPSNSSAPGDPELTRARSSRVPATETIGPYRLLERVGEGGMGEVWLAEQTLPIRRQVAVKVIKAGMDTAQVVARFEAERQALALMDHPAIARVFDAGATPQGRPYFAMEYVRGETITAYATRHRLAIRDRLELFLQVCEGVQHAHQKGIIHRDLKPSNVLIGMRDDSPVAKVIDFGVAKATTQTLTERTLHTELGAFIGTPEYMSPEQAEFGGLDIDTRTDVYALGVILYELLTGTLPFDPKALREQGLDKIRQTIREVDPPRPSTRVTTMAQSAEAASHVGGDPARLARQLRGDLDWVTMKALSKDRARRYGAVSDLAADLRRHLDDVPVLASPPSVQYRVGKFVRRHRAGVAAAAVLVVLLVAFAATMAIQAGRIARERDRANHEAATATQVSDFLVGLFEVSDPSEARGNTLTAREILDKGAAKIDKGLGGEPAVRARLQRTLGAVYTSLGLFSLADPLLEHAVTIDRRVLGPDHPETVATLYAIGEVRYYQSRFPEAEAAYREVAERRRRVLGQDAKDTIEADMAVATAAFEQRRFDDAERLFRSVLERQRRVIGEEDPVTLTTMNNMAGMYYMQKRYSEALQLAVTTFEVLRKTLGEDAPRTLGTQHNVATDLDKLGKHDEAEQLYRKTIDAKRRVLGDAHPDTAKTERALAEMYVNLHRYSDAEPLALTAYDAFHRAVGDASALTQGAIRTVVSLYEAWGKPDKAAEWRAKLSKDPTTTP